MAFLALSLQSASFTLSIFAKSLILLKDLPTIGLLGLCIVANLVQGGWVAKQSVRSVKLYLKLHSLSENTAKRVRSVEISLSIRQVTEDDNTPR